jgi:type I restriction enzyme S subunit
MQLNKQDWQKVSFGDVVSQGKGTVDPETSGLKRYVAGEHMVSEDLHIRQWGTVGDGYLGPAFHRLFEKGDILYGSRRTYLKKVAVADFDGITSNTTFVIKENLDLVEPGFIPFLMLSDRFTEHSIKNSKGSVNPYINFKDITKLEFLLPPRKEQARLAELFWSADEVGEKYRAALDNAQVCFDLLNDTAFLNPSAVFSTYEEITLEECCILQTGIAKGKHYEDGVERVTLPYLRVANVQDGHIDLSEMKEITVSLKEATRFALQAGDVLLTEGGDFDKLGRGAVWNAEITECLHQNHVFCVRPDLERLNSQFVSTQTGSSYGKSYFLINAKKTSNLASINSTQVKKFPMIVPPLSEQEEFVQKSETIKSQIRNLKNCIKQVENVRQQLSNQIFSA